MQEYLQKKSLVMKLDGGINTDGKQVFKSYTYANVDLNADADSIYAAAAALASLYAEIDMVEVQTSAVNDIN